VMKPDSDFTVLFDAVIAAIGEEPDLEVLPDTLRKETDNGSSDYLVGRNIFRAGDFLNGPSTVIEAVTSGRLAARQINISLMGTKQTENEKQTKFISSSFQIDDRVSAVGLPASERSGLDVEESRGISRTEAEKEAGRCFNCGCVAVNPSDIGTVLLALNGKIVTTKRSIDASDFFAPHAKASTVLDTDEMICEILIPKIAVGAKQRYLKFTLRKPIDFSIASVGTVISVNNGICMDARIALGAVAPAPFRANDAEKMLLGRPITEKSATDAAEMAVSGTNPLDKNAYKIQITKALVKKAIMGDSDDGCHADI